MQDLKEFQRHSGFNHKLVKLLVGPRDSSFKNMTNYFMAEEARCLTLQLIM